MLLLIAGKPGSEKSFTAYRISKYLKERLKKSVLYFTLRNFKTFVPFKVRKNSVVVLDEAQRYVQHSPQAESTLILLELLGRMRYDLITVIIIFHGVSQMPGWLKNYDPQLIHLSPLDDNRDKLLEYTLMEISEPGIYQL